MSLSIIDTESFNRFVKDAYLEGWTLDTEQKENLYYAFKWGSSEQGGPFWDRYYLGKPVDEAFIEAINALQHPTRKLGPSITLEIT